MATPLCWGKRTCPHCENVAYWDLHYNGSASCTSCGTLSTANAFEGFETTYIHGYSPLNTLQQNAVYTRLKRFQKYLNRASMRQSMNSVPDDTWRYLIDRGPYNSPGHILRTLKKSKLKRKCYDCLPMLTHHLCTHINVPKLTGRPSSTSASTKHSRSGARSCRTSLFWSLSCANWGDPTSFHSSAASTAASVETSTKRISHR